MSYSYFSFTDKGARPINEDCADIITSELGICLVLCDGLGGHESGELASKCVCESIRHGFETAQADCDTDELVKKLLEDAQRELLVQQETSKKKGMRTTACCVILSGGKCSSAYIGDSRIYHFIHSRAKERSVDHSVPQYLVNMGEIKEKDIRRHPDRNKLLRAMGSRWEKPMYQTPGFSPMKEGDAYLLCSDGFWEWIDEKDMERCLAKAGSVREWIELMCELVLRHGKGHGMDNYSAAAVWVGTPGKPNRSFLNRLVSIFHGKDVH